ncbi:MAG: hypothetical protein ACOYNL_04295 [Rickettsiales bacterium]
MVNAVSGEIFSYQHLKKKAEREISRLEQAEKDLDKNAIDHALNAAFSVYHLLEWKDKTANLNSKTKAQDLLKNKSDESLNILHDIVTFNKHAKLGAPQYGETFEVRTSAKDVNFLTTQSGNFLTTQAGDRLILESSKLTVKFHTKKALDVLKTALADFAL